MQAINISANNILPTFMQTSSVNSFRSSRMDLDGLASSFHHQYPICVSEKKFVHVSQWKINITEGSSGMYKKKDLCKAFQE